MALSTDVPALVRPIRMNRKDDRRSSENTVSLFCPWPSVADGNYNNRSRQCWCFLCHHVKPNEIIRPKSKRQRHVSSIAAISNEDPADA